MANEFGISSHLSDTGGDIDQAKFEKNLRLRQRILLSSYLEDSEDHASGKSFITILVSEVAADTCCTLAVKEMADQ